MIVKKLRNKKNWSQEQLATLSGLSLRTIQRVEAGNSASLETLKSLASVFEVDISKLTEEISVIDKQTEAWKRAPLWVSLGLWGIRRRNAAIVNEKLGFLAGFVGLLGFIGFEYLFVFTTCWITSYWSAVSIRWVDNENLW